MAERIEVIEQHIASIHACRLCPNVHPVPVTGRAVSSQILLVGQAPGDKEPEYGRPFAWTAGKTLFSWFKEACGIDEEAFRNSVYMSAVCRCFPGKKPGGGDRVPSKEEVARCSAWLKTEIALLSPSLVIPVGKLAISQFMPYRSMAFHVGEMFRCDYAGQSFDLIPLPHPSGASPWPRVQPGKALLQTALELIVSHPAIVDKGPL